MPRTESRKANLRCELLETRDLMSASAPLALVAPPPGGATAALAAPISPPQTTALVAAVAPNGVLDAQSNVKFAVLLHLQNIGDRVYRNDEWAGTKGQSRRLEGFQLTLDHPIPGLGLQYMAHLQDISDTSWVADGQFLGTRGQSRRVEGFAIRLTGSQAANYVVVYRAHLEGIGDTGERINGAFLGTRGQSRRVEAMFVSIVPKANYHPHDDPVRDLRGWWGPALEGALAGATPGGVSWLGISRTTTTNQFSYDTRADRVDFSVTINYKQKVFGRTLWSINATVEGWVNLSNPSPATFRVGKVHVAGVSGWDETRIKDAVAYFFRKNADAIRQTRP